MPRTSEEIVGAVASLRRYPVKSMQGEELEACEVTERGLLGDRAYALVDTATGKIASAKNPRKWAKLLDLGAVFSAPPTAAGTLPAVVFTLPTGGTATSAQGDIDQILSQALGRDATLTTSAPQTPLLEEYWPDVEGLDHREVVTEEEMPPGSFFDFAAVHVLTTATLGRLQELNPAGRFKVQRFRPNILVQPATDDPGFIENAWIGRTLALGDGVRLKVNGPCPRCVMTTQPQGDLPKDVGILKTAAQHNEANVGVYASVIQGGPLHLGDSVRLL